MQLIHIARREPERDRLDVLLQLYTLTARRCVEENGRAVAVKQAIGEHLMQAVQQGADQAVLRRRMIDGGMNPDTAYKLLRGTGWQPQRNTDQLELFADG